MADALKCGCRLCPRHRELHRRGNPPLWIKALDAWVTASYPAGSYGRSAAMTVAKEVRRHVLRDRRAQ